MAIFNSYVKRVDPKPDWTAFSVFQRWNANLIFAEVSRILDPVINHISMNRCIHPSYLLYWLVKSPSAPWNQMPDPEIPEMYSGEPVQDPAKEAALRDGSEFTAAKEAVFRKSRGEIWLVNKVFPNWWILYWRGLTHSGCLKEYVEIVKILRDGCLFRVQLGGRAKFLIHFPTPPGGIAWRYAREAFGSSVCVKSQVRAKFSSEVPLKLWCDRYFDVLQCRYWMFIPSGNLT